MTRDAPPRVPTGRYTQPKSAVTDPGILPRQGIRGRQEIVHALVDEQNPAFMGQQQRVAVNVRTDALETEYAHRRLSENAYRAGRTYQRVLELSGGRPSGGGQWMEGDRVDAASAHESAIWRAIDTAKQAQEMMLDVLPVIGVMGENILRMTLQDRLTIAQATSLCEGSSTRMQVSYYAETFRRSLELIADHWAKRSRAY